MAEEGERSDLTGAYSWNKESAADTARRQRAEQAQEKAELIQQYRRTDIASHIGALQQQAKTPLYDLEAPGSGVDRDKQERANLRRH